MLDGGSIPPASTIAGTESRFFFEVTDQRPGEAMTRAKGCTLFLARKRAISFLSIVALSWIFSVPVCAESFPQANDIERVLLPESARHFNIITNWKPAEWKISFHSGDHHAEVLIGSDRLIVDDYLMALSSPVTAGEGTVTMALADSADFLSRMLDREVTEAEIRSADLVFRHRPETVESIQIKNIRYISYPRFTRLILNVSGTRTTEEIEVECVEDAKALTVKLPSCRFAQSTDVIKVEDRIVDLVEPIQMGVEARLVVKTLGEEIKYRIQRFDDPPRVVIDIEPASPTIVAKIFHGEVLPPQTNGLPSPHEPAVQQKRAPFMTILIDPGHGGKDQGAAGPGGLLEKEVTLEVALRLKRIIEKTPGVKVALTRTGDYFVSLKERTAIANHAREGMPADLFISIHTNAHESPRVGGFEAYYVSDAMDPDAEATATLKNVVLEFEREADDRAASSLTPILWDLQYAEFISQSSEFAFIAQEELGKRLNTRNRGVRQGKFIVLSSVAMPAILVEVGYISNRIEEANMKTADFKTRCAEALAAAVAAFRERHDTRLGLLNSGLSP